MESNPTTSFLFFSSISLTLFLSLFLCSIFPCLFFSLFPRTQGPQPRTHLLPWPSPAPFSFQWPPCSSLIFSTVPSISSGLHVDFCALLVESASTKFLILKLGPRMLILSHLSLYCLSLLKVILYYSQSFCKAPLQWLSILTLIYSGLACFAFGTFAVPSAGLGSEKLNLALFYGLPPNWVLAEFNLR